MNRKVGRPRKEIDVIGWMQRRKNKVRTMTYRDIATALNSSVTLIVSRIKEARAKGIEVPKTVARGPKRRISIAEFLRKNPEARKWSRQLLAAHLGYSEIHIYYELRKLHREKSPLVRYFTFRG